MGQWQTRAQALYFNTSSTVLGQNTVDRASTNGGSATTLFTATGSDLNHVNRCTAVAVDALNSKLFLIDGPTGDMWSLNLDGTGLALVKSGLIGFPTDLALDVLNQFIYYTTSSTLQGSNTVQRLGYAGGDPTTLITATGAVSGNGISRCTAIALDVPRGRIFIADAGAEKIWSMSLDGTGLAALATASNAVPTGVALDSGNQQVYFTLSSPVENSNRVMRVSYAGTGLTTLFTAGSGVQRCTALDLDLRGGFIYLSDAAAGDLWRIPLGGGTPSPILSGLTATAKKVRWFSGPEAPPSPDITSLVVSGPKVIINATNGFVGGTYYLLTSTNLSLPLSDWSSIATNVLGSSGSFSLTAPNPSESGSSRQFYVLRVQ